MASPRAARTIRGSAAAGRAGPVAVAQYAALGDAWPAKQQLQRTIMRALTLPCRLRHHRLACCKTCIMPPPSLQARSRAPEGAALQAACCLCRHACCLLPWDLQATPGTCQITMFSSHARHESSPTSIPRWGSAQHTKQGRDRARNERLELCRDLCNLLGALNCALRAGPPSESEAPTREG